MIIAGSSALGKGLWGCMAHLRSLLCFGIIAVALSNVLYFSPSWAESMDTPQ